MNAINKGLFSILFLITTIKAADVAVSFTDIIDGKYGNGHIQEKNSNWFYWSFGQFNSAMEKDVLMGKYGFLTPKDRMACEAFNRAILYSGALHGYGAHQNYHGFILDLSGDFITKIINNGDFNGGKDTYYLNALDLDDLKPIPGINIYDIREMNFSNNHLSCINFKFLGFLIKYNYPNLRKLTVTNSGISGDIKDLKLDPKITVIN